MGEFPNKATQFKPGNPGGGKPKGSKHLSTWIREMMADEDFTTYLQHPTKGFEEFKGAPVKAIVQTAIQKAAQGDKDARDWLAKYGYGTRLDVTSNDEKLEGLVIIKHADD